ncbi:HAMP domain-containing sensor histidine kinase [Actinomadura rudentiformis]|uniref:histidine kinase n=1 Tax=Actinomadura rudentiformis TaxID=359158 RepID=A0A6H9YJR4_9ACTN|nr:HAMP domain-containing sensor histidine kinase [Actinomadura rudentiformis]KAB2341615.1 HAMP domain-containing sensor histidine kinase [Actinomadura rudentiformis]
MRLFWRVFWLNALVGVVATVLLMVGPWTVSVPIRLIEAVVLVAGLAVMLALNAALLRWGLAPLDRLSRLMTTVDLLRPGQRLPVTGSGEVAALIEAFNQMLARLEAERGASSIRALSAQEGERRRIARELHDEIGQSLTAVLLELKRLADRVPESLREDVRYTQETTRTSLEDVRRIARRLRPDVLEDLGLVSALTALTTQFATHTALRVRRHLPADLPPLSPQTELVLYRIAQEALTNTARHSDATAAELSLTHQGGGVLLRIDDNGKGLNGAPEGAGIQGMRERALLVGGQLTLGPGPAGGTRISLQVPITVSIAEEGPPP